QASAICHNRDRRSASSSGDIQRLLAQFQHLEKVRVTHGFTYDEIDVAFEELLERNQQLEIRTVESGRLVRKKLHHEVQIARRRIERPLRRRSENRQTLHAVFLAQRPHLVEVLRDDLR